jgi:hypothetical protein
VETIVIEKVVVLKDRAVEPIGPPAPTAPTEAAEEASDVNARAEAESKIEVRVI